MTRHKMSGSMRANRRFFDDLLALLQKSKGLRLRAGVGAYRFISIWFVVVKDRVLVRERETRRLVPHVSQRTSRYDSSGRLRSRGPRRAYKERASERRG